MTKSNEARELWKITRHGHSTVYWDSPCTDNGAISERFIEHSAYEALEAKCAKYEAALNRIIKLDDDISLDTAQFIAKEALE